MTFVSKFSLQVLPEEARISFPCFFDCNFLAIFFTLKHLLLIVYCRVGWLWESAACVGSVGGEVCGPYWAPVLLHLLP